MNSDNLPLKDEIDTAPWDWLRAHLMQDSIIIIDSKLVLHEIAEKMVKNDTVYIEHLINNQLISKPSAQQISLWNSTPDILFSILIIRPYILIQEVQKKP